MSNTAITVSAITKRYNIGRKQAKYKTLRDTIMESVASPFKRLGKVLKGEAYGAAQLDDVIWALSGISFEVKQGDAVGIIGRNGSGKSTLLKILSRITDPTGGYVEIKGRVGSLLEVGTGFHHELTGRENIYLNGAILGMKRVEINRKFDEIVSFAEIDRFVDTPVKHFSSGMYLRLAFAVAAHLEPEILLVDEVLAVGDARFQKKCINKMQDVGKEGRTVLFVSHNMAAVTRLCKNAMLLDEGKLIKSGPSHHVVSAYLDTGKGRTAERTWDIQQAPGGSVARLLAVRLRNHDGEITDKMDIRRPVFVEMEYDVKQPGFILMPYFHFYNEEDIQICALHDCDREWRRRRRQEGRYLSSVMIPGNFLSEGIIFVNCGLMTIDPEMPECYVRDAVTMNVIDSLDGDTARGEWHREMGGVVRPLLEWKTRVILNGRRASSSSI